MRTRLSLAGALAASLLARLSLAGALAASLLAAFIPSAAAVTAGAGTLSGAARLEGSFALTGRVTVAVHMKAEHRGQLVARTWSFQPLCATGPCANVQLTRQRAAGTDTLTLHRVAPNYYRGGARFLAPLGCGGQLHAAGEAVPFTITVRVTASSGSSAGPIATKIRATYTGRTRLNLTRCVLPPSHDAAVYRGVLQDPTPPAASSAAPPGRELSARSPAGS